MCVAAGLFAVGCQPPGTNTTVTTNTSNFNATANSNLANTNIGNLSNVNTVASANSVDTREPEKYQAKVRLSLQSSSDTQKVSTPPITAVVARDGVNRRVEFTLPNQEQLIFLDTNGKKLLISPNRKQYAELNKESVGFDVPAFLLPEQIVQRVKNQKGVELVGEEQLNGRTVTKYRYGSITNTQTQAGQVNTESFLVVDKETGLPLRTETVAESESGQVQGMKNLRIVTEMSDISTNITPEMFSEPTDFQKVAPEQVRSQVNMLFNIITGIVGQLMKTNPTAAPAPVNTTNTNATPAPTANTNQ